MNEDHQDFISRKYFSAGIGEDLRPNEMKNIPVDMTNRGYIFLRRCIGDGL
jgi:hypothetical protein